MARIFRIVVLILVLWDSQCANGTERTNITSSTGTRVILGEDKREAEPNEFNPAECFDKIWGIINDEFWDPDFNGATNRSIEPIADAITGLSIVN
ncbi:MAG TPA: hypothetical protein VMX36_06555 [Sedimentisphaerales bacterium]|nr:hypothetical protein [Sedimentisphaerales bacterium]